MSVQESKAGHQLNITNDNPILDNRVKNTTFLRNIFKDSYDFIIREVTLNSKKNVGVSIFYFEGIVSNTLINEFVLEELMSSPLVQSLIQENTPSDRLLEIIYSRLLTTSGAHYVDNMRKILDDLFIGNTIILIDGCAKGISISSTYILERAITPPENQTVIRGPRDSFNEVMRTNVMLIRRRIKDENLQCVKKTVGRVSKTTVVLMYMKGIADEGIVKEVNSRIDRVDVDGIMDSGELEDYIQDDHFSFFPTIYNTERPDATVANILEGKIAILTDGSPSALIVPAIFGQFFISAEDYYQRWGFSTLVSILRYISFLIGLLAPAVYIALTTYHQEMIPTPLLISIAAQREGLPFPAFIEALIMQTAFEILREAGIRMPKQLGQAISIVGALVIGQAAVEAGFVSAAMVIVVSITSISTFIFPAYSMSIPVRILMFGFMILGATFGLYGITLGLIFLVVHLCSLRSFGVPYMIPFGPFKSESQMDMIFKFPKWMNKKRPEEIAQGNITRNKTPNPTKPKFK